MTKQEWERLQVGDRVTAKECDILGSVIKPAGTIKNFNHTQSKALVKWDAIKLADRTLPPAESWVGRMKVFLE